MPGTTEIRHHISAVEQTMKITGAMEMVSSNRMRRVMSHIEYNRQYFYYIRNAMKEILASSEGFQHHYLTERENAQRTYIVISGDKGLCGAYNSTVLEYARREMENYPGCSLITIGNTAEDFFRHRGHLPDVAMLGIVQDPTLTLARRATRDLIRMYDEGVTDEIYVIYTSFYGASKGKPVQFRLLPVKLHDYADVAGNRLEADMIYQPSKSLVFDQLVPQYVVGLLFGVMVQAYAGEHYARMNAMHSSTQNAGDMLKSLQAKYNLARQSAITNEIAEITGSAEILKGGDDYA